MRIRLYLDEDTMDSDLVSALRLRGIEVTTALEVGLTNSTDEEQLEYATKHGRTLYSFNVSDFMDLHISCVATGKQHAGDYSRSTATLPWVNRCGAWSALDKCDPLRAYAIRSSS